MNYSILILIKENHQFLLKFLIFNISSKEGIQFLSEVKIWDQLVFYLIECLFSFPILLRLKFYAREKLSIVKCWTHSLTVFQCTLSVFEALCVGKKLPSRSWGNLWYSTSLLKHVNPLCLPPLPQILTLTWHPFPILMWIAPYIPLFFSLVSVSLCLPVFRQYTCGSWTSRWRVTPRVCQSSRNVGARLMVDCQSSAGIICISYNVLIEALWKLFIILSLFKLMLIFSMYNDDCGAS